MMQREPTCTIPGCDGKHVARGWCEKHYTRWKRHGSTDRPSRSGPNNGRWLADDVVGYFVVHRRMGTASIHPCADCGNPAQDWAYDGGCAAERTENVYGRDLAFCPHPEHYRPRCRVCHYRLDRL